jgi:aspartyl protease
VRKVLFLILLVTTLICNADDELRARFVLTYYSGDFVKAHDQLDAAFSDPVLHSIWEERIHHHGEIANCKHESSAGALGFAILKTGDVESAAKVFQDDWLSLLGKATTSTWQNDLYKARELVLESVKLAPDRPEPYYFAGNLSHTTDESTGYFLQFLKLIKEDPYRKQSVENAIEFMNRTRGMELNIPTKLEDFEELESKIEDGRLLVKVNIDGEKKIPLMVDTGAGGLALKNKKWNPQVQTDLLLFGIGKKPATKGSKVVLTQFDSGRFNIKNPVASISQDLSTSGIDGVVGTTFFSAGNVLLVPMKSGRKFTLFSTGSDYRKYIDEKNFHEKTEVPFLLVGGMIIIKGTMRSSPQLNFLVDTGAKRTIISALAAKQYTRINYALSREMKQTTPLTGIGGRMEDVLVSENVNIEAGPLKKEFNIMSVVNLAEGSENMEIEIGGILGRDILDGYTLLIDYGKRSITFLR